MSKANESAAANGQSADTNESAPVALEQVLDAAEEAAAQSDDYSEASVGAFLEEELTKLFAAETAEPEPEKKEDEPAADAAAEETEADKEPEEDVSQPEEEESVFEREENRPILSDEEIDREFERTPHSIRNELKRVSAYARSYRDFVDSIGGQEFIPVAAQVTKALATRDHNGVFTSLVTSLGLPSFADVLESAVDLAFVQPVQQDAPQTEESKWFMSRLQDIADRSMKARYGESVGMETLDRLVRLNKVGAFDLDSLEELYADELKPESFPVVEKLQAELAREREEKEALKKQAELEEKQEQEHRAVIFDKLADESIEKSFEPLFAASVLRAVKEDKPEEAAVKEALREAVILRAAQEFRTGEQYRALRERFASGEARTAVFTADFGKAVAAARAAAKPFASKFERLFKDTYLTKRNAQVLGVKKDAPEKQPTPTTQFGAGEKSYKEMTDEEFEEYTKRVLSSAQAV